MRLRLSIKRYFPEPLIILSRLRYCRTSESYFGWVNICPLLYDAEQIWDLSILRFPGLSQGLEESEDTSLVIT